MSTADYVIDFLLIALVLLQVKPRPLAARWLLAPAALLAGTGAVYLRAVPTGGNDLLADAVLVAVGAMFGTVSGLTTQVFTEHGRVMARAGDLAVVSWMLGMGIQLGFDIWAHTRSGATELGHFSVQHSITTSNAFVVAFALMAFAQVALRVCILEFRRFRLSQPAWRAPAG